MPVLDIKQATRSDWRELGFFYDKDDEAKHWIVQGSKIGLLELADILREYVADSRNERISEHEHYGPYMYFEIGTWNEPQINDHWIAGPLPELAKLAQTIEQAIMQADVGDCIKLKDSFAPSAIYDLILEVKDDQFDPASADKGCW